MFGSLPWIISAFATGGLITQMLNPPVVNNVTENGDIIQAQEEKDLLGGLGGLMTGGVGGILGILLLSQFMGMGTSQNNLAPSQPIYITLNEDEDGVWR